MTATQTAIVAALIGSPFIYSTFEYMSNRVRAKFRYKGWQAVFLDNGQVYFGKIKSISKSDLDLTDIYYLNKDENVQPGNISPDMHLIKLGEEVHGPKDVMTVSRSHIMFSEQLKDNSSVVEAIMDYKRGVRVQNVDLTKHKIGKSG